MPPDFYAIVHQIEREPCNQLVEHISYLSQTDFIIYPNPGLAGQVFTVSLNSPSQSGIIKIVNDYTGQVVYSSPITYDAPVNASLPSSAYTVSFIDGESETNKALIIN